MLESVLLFETESHCIALASQADFELSEICLLLRVLISVLDVL